MDLLATPINREAIGWTRGDYYTANGRRLANIRSMLSDWKELKALRQSQGFAATNCQLVVRKMKTSGAAQLDWDEEIERQMDESRRLFQEHVRSDVDRYKRQKTRWKEARKKRRVLLLIPRFLTRHIHDIFPLSFTRTSRTFRTVRTRQNVTTDNITLAR